MPANSIFKLALIFGVLLVLVLALLPGPGQTLLGSDWKRHAAGFVFLTLALHLLAPRLPLSTLWPVLVALGAVIEAIQWISGLGRTADFRDWVDDVWAISVTVALIWICKRFKRAREA